MDPLLVPSKSRVYVPPSGREALRANIYNTALFRTNSLMFCRAAPCCRRFLCGNREKEMLSLFRRFSTADTRLCRAEWRWQNPGIKEFPPKKLHTGRVIIVGYGAFDVPQTNTRNDGTPPCSHSLLDTGTLPLMKLCRVYQTNAYIIQRFRILFSFLMA